MYSDECSRQIIEELAKNILIVLPSGSANNIIRGYPNKYVDCSVVLLNATTSFIYLMD